MIGHQERVRYLGPVRRRNGINPAPELDKAAGFDPAVQLPPQGISGASSRKKERGGENRAASGNIQ
jgi:hypothetical protein